MERFFPAGKPLKYCLNHLIRLQISVHSADPTPVSPVHTSTNTDGWRLCVAPMIDVTDRHCRYFHRLLAPQARLYTEMITTGALHHGDIPRHLDFSAEEHPVALQLGGSDPAELAVSSKMGEQWGYDEINLNCGCPSERVQKGSFGACLMAEPQLVADCLKAMQDSQSLPVTVKHRLGLDGDQSYGFVRDFVGTLYDNGCRVFIVHARNAVLKGLSPRDNREIPPLRYDDAARIKKDFPDATVVLNGGLNTVAQCDEVIQNFDGVMLGRAAWQNPGVLAQLNSHWWQTDQIDERDLIAKLVSYADHQMHADVPLRVLVRPLLGLFTGRAGARYWRRMLSDNKLLQTSSAQVIEQAWQCVGQACEALS